MRSIIVLVDDTGLHVSSELKSMTERHQCTVLLNPSPQAVWDACRAQHYRIAYFGCHGGPQFLEMAHKETISRQDLMQCMRMTGASCVVLNSCDTGALGSFLSREIEFVVCANEDIADAEAWKFPLAFSDALGDGSAGNIAHAYAVASPDNGQYSMLVRPEWLAVALDEHQQMAALLTPERISLSRRFVASMFVVYGLIYGITIIATFWLGRGG